ncbi:MAG: S8 family serine peptidase, partial [Anaerolineae bacterium]|nr:S8 family serine peptidase [Anaerolineae bacterium]
SGLLGKDIDLPSHRSPDSHAAQVAGVLFGDDSRAPYRQGIAHGSTELVTVGDGKFTHTAVDVLVDNDAYVINISLAINASRETQWEDRVLDHVVRYRDPTIVVSSGNCTDPFQPRHVTSPAKAYNVVTVGAFEDNDDGDWSGDTMRRSSCYVDPYIDVNDPQPYQTHQKPDVVAVGGDVITVADAQGNGYVRTWGTSIAAPQVTGLAALLVQRYWWLRVNPETVKAIIMASAIHNIEGSTRLSDKDGAGGIVASEAMAVFDRGGWAHHIIHDIDDPGDPSNPFDGSGSSYDFRGSDTGIWDVGGTNAYAGERVRAVLCWSSNPTGDLYSVGSDQLSTDLDLQVVAPNGTVVDWSVSLYNSCEIVDFVAPQTGEYRMRVTLYNTSGESLDLGLGLAWLRIPMQHVYLPAVMKNY